MTQNHLTNNESINKMWYVHIRLLFNNKKEWSHDTCYNMNELENIK